MSTTSERYTTVAIVLHWAIALLIIGQLIGGKIMVDFLADGSSLKFELYQWHKSFGVTILLLSLARAVWRLTHRPPALPAHMKSWERIGARISHVGFYLLIIGAPLAGWALVSASPFAASVPTYLFGFIPWPHLPFFEGVEDRKAVAELIAEIHEYMGFAIVLLLVVHIGAALKHHFVDRDGVFTRMAPWIVNRKVRS